MSSHTEVSQRALLAIQYAINETHDRAGLEALLRVLSHMGSVNFAGFIHGDNRIIFEELKHNIADKLNSLPK